MVPECNAWDLHVGRRGPIGTRCPLISTCLLQCICAHKQNKSNNEKSCREELRHTRSSFEILLFLDYGSLTLEINCEEIVQGSSEVFLKVQIINILGFVI